MGTRFGPKVDCLGYLSYSNVACLTGDSPATLGSPPTRLGATVSRDLGVILQKIRAFGMLGANDSIFARLLQLVWCEKHRVKLSDGFPVAAAKDKSSKREKIREFGMLDANDPTLIYTIGLWTILYFPFLTNHKNLLIL